MKWDEIDWQAARVWVGVYLLVLAFWTLTGWSIWRVLR